jgi:hypothetical protein
VKVDFDLSDNPGAKELYDKYIVGEVTGLPAWTILDADKKVLANCMRDKRNVGFPYEPHEVEHFFAAVKKACPKVSEDDLKILKERLDEHIKAAKAQIEARKKEAEKR